MAYQSKVLALTPENLAQIENSGRSILTNIVNLPAYLVGKTLKFQATPNQHGEYEIRQLDDEDSKNTLLLLEGMHFYTDENGKEVEAEVSTKLSSTKQALAVAQMLKANPDLVFEVTIGQYTKKNGQDVTTSQIKGSNFKKSIAKPVDTATAPKAEAGEGVGNE